MIFLDIKFLWFRVHKYKKKIQDSNAIIIRKAIICLNPKNECFAALVIIIIIISTDLGACDGLLLKYDNNDLLMSSCFMLNLLLFFGLQVVLISRHVRFGSLSPAPLGKNQVWQFKGNHCHRKTSFQFLLNIGMPFWVSVYLK